MNTKDIVKTVRFSQEEYREIKKKADQMGDKFSVYVREAALDHEIVVIEDLKEFQRQLYKVGNNLNQLTKLCHEGRIMNPDIDETTKLVKDIFDLLLQIKGG